MTNERLDTVEPFAPGWPGIEPRWTSSAKSGVGTALTATSRVWFTLSHGILNEIYFRRPDHACTRDLGLIVTDGAGFFSEEKRHAEHEIRVIESGVPAYELVNTHAGRYRITKRIIADPWRDVILQEVTFDALSGARGDYRLFALLAPHLVNAGAGNTAWIGEHKGVPMLFAQGRGTALALGCSLPWRRASAGFVGISDGWQTLSKCGTLEPRWARAENGNVALTGEIDLSQAGVVTLALGFGVCPEEAAHRVRSSLHYGFPNACRDYIAGWRPAIEQMLPLTPRSKGKAYDPYRTSVSVILSHEPYSFPGGIIASLSIPWGFSKGDDDLGGYHLVWPRDLVETAGGLAAAGLNLPARAVLGYLAAVQEADGRWPQNMWLDGTPYWGGIQLDECAFPILLVDLLHREKFL
jgi:glucoamylase